MKFLLQPIDQNLDGNTIRTSLNFSYEMGRHQGGSRYHFSEWWFKLVGGKPKFSMNVVTHFHYTAIDA